MRWISLTMTMLIALPTFGQEQPEPLPTPEAPEPRRLLGPLPEMRFELTKTGYEVILDRAAAERMLKRLQNTDPEQVGDTIRRKKVLDRDDETRAQTEMIAVAVTKDLPRFIEELEKKTGPGGAVIKMIGAEKKPEQDRPVLKFLADRMQPDRRERAEKLIKIARIQPVYWKIEPRE